MEYTVVVHQAEEEGVLGGSSGAAGLLLPRRIR